MQKNDVKPNLRHWQPTADRSTLIARAKILREIRAFFHERDILEVETPLLSHTTVTDPYLQSIPAQITCAGGEPIYGYLQTSPEFAMKRLLAAGLGPIYQLTKAFRQEEKGRSHNPEFTLLEWYRPQFDHHRLMEEVDVFLQTILKTGDAQKITYQDAFLEALNVDPQKATVEILIACARKQNIELSTRHLSKDDLLNLLLSHCIEPHLGKTAPIFLYDFPATQAALAKLQPENPSIASRFEVYFKGVELGNGFYELCDEKEQRKRFEKDLLSRQQQGLPPVPIDECLLSALSHGLPDCAGIALGIDRLMMLALGKKHIREVLSFDFERA